MTHLKYIDIAKGWLILCLCFCYFGQAQSLNGAYLLGWNNIMALFICCISLGKIPHNQLYAIFAWEVTTFVIVVISSYILIFLFVKYIPYLVTQQDFVRFTFSKR